MISLDIRSFRDWECRGAKPLCRSFRGRMGVSPKYLKSPKIGGFRGLIDVAGAIPLDKHPFAMLKSAHRGYLLIPIIIF